MKQIKKCLGTLLGACHGLRGSRGVALVLFVSLSGIGVFWRSQPEVFRALVAEEGLIQNLSAGLWFLSSAWCAVLIFQDIPLRKEWGLGTVFFFLLGMRELDAQQWVTGWNVETLEKYWDPRIPLDERVLAFSFFVVFFGMVLSVFPPRKWIYLKRAWQSGVAWTRDLLIWIVMLVLAIGFDKFDPASFPIEFSNPQDVVIIKGILEESMEFSLAMSLVVFMAPIWVDKISSSE